MKNAFPTTVFTPWNVKYWHRQENLLWSRKWYSFYENYYFLSNEHQFVKLAVMFYLISSSFLTVNDNRYTCTFKSFKF